MDDLSEIIVNGIDVKKVLEYHTGTLDDYVEILNLFYMDGLNKVQLIEDLAKQCDWKNYRIEVHALKSASANLGAMELSDKAKAHEDAAKEQNDGFIRENLDDLLSTYRKLLNEIRQVLVRKGKQKQASDGPRKKIEAKELTEGIREALELVEHFKSKACLEKVEWLLEHELEENVQKVLEEIQRKLTMYDDDEAEDMLRNLAGTFGTIQKTEGE